MRQDIAKLCFELSSLMNCSPSDTISLTADSVPVHEMSLLHDRLLLGMAVTNRSGECPKSAHMSYGSALCTIS